MAPPVKSKFLWLADDNGCWVWQRGRTSAGYGMMTRDGKRMYAHRVFYEDRHGPIPTAWSWTISAGAGRA